MAHAVTIKDFEDHIATNVIASGNDIDGDYKCLSVVTYPSRGEMYFLITTRTMLSKRAVFEHAINLYNSL